MKIFQCNTCYNPIFFENTVCEKCGASLGYISRQNILSTLEERAGNWKALAHPATIYRYCQNHTHGVCNWLVTADSRKALCRACELNRTIPDLNNPGHLSAWQKLENAKHRLVYSLLRFGLPLQSKFECPEAGLCFDFLAGDASNPYQSGAMTGHEQGVITINVAEADSVHREQTRTQMVEPYRTLIGHFRHEIGHYYWERLVKSDANTLHSFRALFGDESADYSEALRHYHSVGPPADWREHYVSAYCVAHPWEDWAETWAHYFHLVDTLETAFAFRIGLNPDLEHLAQLKMQADFDPYRQTDFESIITACIPLTLAINSLNRSMGQPDLYPFVLPMPVLEKLRFVHRLLQ